MEPSPGRLRWRALRGHVAAEACAGAGARRGAAASWRAPACAGWLGARPGLCSHGGGQVHHRRAERGRGGLQQCKGISTPGELPVAMGAHPGVSPTGKSSGAGARPGHPISSGLPEWQRCSRNCGSPRIALGGCRTPTLLMPNPTEQPAAGISPVSPQHSCCWRNQGSREGHVEPPMASQPPEPSQRLCTGSHHSAAPRPCRRRPGLRLQSRRHGAWLTSESWLQRGRSGREGNKSK